MGKIFSRKKLVVIFCVIACIIFSSCVERDSVAEIYARKKILLIGNAADPSTLDPSFATGLSEFKIMTALFEGLVSADSKNLKIIPAAAESWSKDGLKYRFKIRDNAKWSDGEDLKASDFVYAFKRILNPNLGAEYSYFLYPIKNAKALHTSKVKDFDLLGARALDTKTLEIELERPCVYFFELLYHSAFFPLPEHILKRFDAGMSRNVKWTKPENIVSNGGFILKSWEVNNKVEVVKNGMYWDKESIKLEGITFLPISNVNTEDRAFRSFQIHVTDSATPFRMNKIKQENSADLRTSDWLGTYYYLFNTAKEPFNDVRVRRAMSLAINRQSIVNNFLRGGQKAAYSFVPKIENEYDSRFKIREDIEEAKRLLGEAGFKDGKNFPTIRLVYNTSEQHKPIAEAVQAVWKKNLGIEVVLYNLSWPAYLQARREGDFEITRASWVADFKSAGSFLNIFETSSLINHSRWHSKEFDKLIDMAKVDDTQKNYSEAERVLLEESVIIPIYFYSRTYFVSRIVKNWNDNILDYRNYKGIYFDD